MPMFDYVCGKCKHRQSHFVQTGDQFSKPCPTCGSADYSKTFSPFKSDVEYSNTHEYNERVMTPAVNEVYQTIGREALDEDTKTLENVFGSEAVSNTLAPTDD